MDAISNFAGKMFLKQKMGSITDSIPGIGGKGDAAEKKSATAAPTSKQLRESINSGRAERDAELARQKEERTSKKSGLKMSERWAQNKEANR